MSLTPRSADNFQRLRELLQENTKENLKTLCELDIIQVVNCFTETENILKTEIDDMLYTLLESYEYKKPIYELAEKLRKDGELVILSIYKSNILVFVVKLSKISKFLCLGTFDYQFKTEIYYLELTIDNTIHILEVSEILKTPTSKNIENFNSHF